MKESEDNLENFFRNRAESNQYGYKKGDWAKMEAMLNAGMPVVSPFPYTNLKWMAVGSIMTALLILGYIKFSELEKIGEPTFISKQLANSPQLKLQVNSSEGVRIQNNSSDNTFAENIENLDGSCLNALPITSDGISCIDSSEQTVVATNVSKNELQNIIGKKLLPSNTVALSNNHRTENLIERSAVLQSSNDVVIPKVKPKKVDYVYEKGNLLASSIEKVKVTLELIQTKKVYTLSLIGAMDITSTKASEWGDPTIRFGLSGEYYIGNRWSIGIGANLSKKKYQAKGSEYSPPTGFWTNGVVPDSTNAICDVLDVPISVSYFQPLSKKSNLIISGGVSSWFMLTEEYWYKYKSNDPNLVSWWGGENENRYWFSVINVSMAYEYSLNNKWSVAVGPYVNIPLSGVGHGNVELQSFGLKGALRFNKFKLKF